MHLAVAMEADHEGRLVSRSATALQMQGRLLQGPQHGGDGRAAVQQRQQRQGQQQLQQQLLFQQQQQQCQGSMQQWQCWDDTDAMVISSGASKKRKLEQDVTVFSTDSLRKNLCSSPLTLPDQGGSLSKRGGRGLMSLARQHRQMMHRSSFSNGVAKRQRTDPTVFVKSLSGRVLVLEFPSSQLSEGGCGDKVTVHDVLAKLEEEGAVSRERFKLMYNNRVLNPVLDLMVDVKAGALLHMVEQV